MKKNAADRCFTIIIAPHSEESVYSFCIPVLWCKAACVFTVLIVAAFFSILYNYGHLYSKMQENIALRASNLEQRVTIEEIGSETETLLSKMHEIELLSSEIAGRLGVNPNGEGEEGIAVMDNPVSEDHARLLASRQGPVLDRVQSNISDLHRLLPQQNEILEELREEVDEYKRRLDRTPSIWPSWGRLTSGFGMRRSPFYPYGPEFHRGVDIANAHGTSIYTTAAGTVNFCGYRGGYGNMISIRHGYGFTTVYAHLSRMIVTNGQQVNKGQVIGYMGRTGTTTGTHLHYEVHVNGVPVNPRNYMR